MKHQPTSTRARIKPRDLGLEFSGVPRKWMAGSAAATGITNGVNLLFPAGERYFVRSVNYFLDRIDDPALRADIKGFFGQEGRHAREHDRFNDVMRTQGYQIDQFLDRYTRLSAWVEAKSSPKLRLATTAAAEHFTATMAEGAFAASTLDAAHPAMRALLAWHAAEEIEHKAVAYDVLQAIDPSYALRVAGLVMATLMLGGFWFAAATMLLRQDGLTWRAAIRELRALPGRQNIIGGVFGRGIRAYLRRDFHPHDRDTAALAASWMAARGIALAEAA